MNTQNVNVKTATKESSERWVKSTALRTDGFVRNIHACNPFDVIRADVVLARIEKEAGRCCGMHFELYQARVLGDALDYGVLRRNRRNFRYPSFSPETSASRSMISLLL